MPRVTVRYLPALHNQRFLTRFNAMKTAFVTAIPSALATAIRLVSTAVAQLKAGGVAVGAVASMDINLTLNNVAVAGIPQDFLDTANRPASPAGANYTVQEGFAVLHWLQKNLQKLWLIALDELAARRINTIIGRLRATNPHDILMFVLPEFYFTFFPIASIHNSIRHIVGVGGLAVRGNATGVAGDIQGIKNYSKPFYSDTLNVLLAGVDVHNAVRPNSLFELGQKENVIIVGGTFRWKEIDAGNHANETIYNTLPIFSRLGGNPHMWTKINTSQLDGHGNRRVVGVKKVPEAGAARWDAVNNRFIVPANTPAGLGTWLDLPYFSYPLANGNQLKIGIDICLDYIAGGGSSGSVLRKAINNGVAGGINILPHIHLLVAAGMEMAGDNLQLALQAGRYNAQVAVRNDGGGIAARAGGVANAFQRERGAMVAQVPGPVTYDGWFSEYEFVVDV